MIKSFEEWTTYPDPDMKVFKTTLTERAAETLKWVALGRSFDVAAAGVEKGAEYYLLKVLTQDHEGDVTLYGESEGWAQVETMLSSYAQDIRNDMNERLDVGQPVCDPLVIEEHQMVTLAWRLSQELQDNRLRSEAERAKDESAN